MRLIDADNMNLLLKDMVEKETGAFTKGYNKALRDVKSMINNPEQCPTSYDINKVVDELQSDVKRWEDSGKEYNDKCEIAVARGLRNSIEIVKQGGVSDDVCEWKHFSNDKSPYRPSCSQYMKSKFEAFKFGDYCPFCGKKIKVVE